MSFLFLGPPGRLPPAAGPGASLPRPPARQDPHQKQETTPFHKEEYI